MFSRRGLSGLKGLRFFGGLPKKRGRNNLPCVSRLMTYGEVVDRDMGLKRFIRKTHLYTGSGLMFTLSGGVLMSYVPPIMFVETPIMFVETIPVLLGGGFMCSLAGIIAMSFGKYDVHETTLIHPQTGNIAEILHSKNSFMRSQGYGATILGVTMFTSPLLAMANHDGILIPALLSTGLVFGGATYYTHTLKKGELESLGPALYGGMCGLVGCGLVGLCSTIFFGPNPFSVFIHSVDVYAGIPFFGVMVAYDTHKAITMYGEGDPDHLGCSLALYMDSVNILIRITEVMNRFKGDRD